MTQAATIAYLTAARIPSERAHAIQIVKTCEALGKVGVPVTLIVPRRFGRSASDPFSYHNLKQTFTVQYLPTIDTVNLGRVGFRFHQCIFGVTAAFYLLMRHRGSVVYSRDEVLLWILRNFGIKKMVWESHQGSINWFARRLIDAGVPIIVISQGLKEWYQARGVPSYQLLVAHDGIDLAQFEKRASSGEIKEKLGLPLEEKIVMYIGSLQEWKGYRTLLAATPLLRGVAKVVVIGGSPSQIAVLKNEYPEVLFLGERPYAELPQNQRAADVLVVPNTARSTVSAKFTSPLKVFAHMASGIPIVASNIPSLREILNERNAFLVDPDNPKALAMGVQCALEKEGERATIAMQDVVQYTWEVRVQGILKHIADYASY